MNLLSTVMAIALALGAPLSAMANDGDSPYPKAPYKGHRYSGDEGTSRKRPSPNTGNVKSDYLNAMETTRPPADARVLSETGVITSPTTRGDH